MSALRLTLQQPMQIGDQARSDALLPTLRHIPGAVVRGALASAWITRNGTPSPRSPKRAEFVALFEGGVRYGPLFSGAPCRSLAVRTHKYRAGETCALVDVDEVEHPGAPAACPDCGSPMISGKGVPDAPDVGVRRRTSVVIGPSGVALSGGLFSRDTVAQTQADGSPLTFVGHVMAADSDLLQVIASLETVRVGGRRTTHGLASITVEPGVAPKPAQVLADGRVVLRLRSPAVFVDDSGRPSPRPEAHHLAPYFGPEAMVKQAWYRWQAIGGWHVASGLPKPVELAVTAGSTYVVRPGRVVSDDDLARLAHDGIGLRRHEGFGDVGDVAPLRPGRAEREAERLRVQALVSPVRRAFHVSTRGEVRDRVRSLLRSHADGDVSATATLRTLLKQLPDRGAAGHLEALMSYRPEDIHTVLGEWR